MLGLKDPVAIPSLRQLLNDENEYTRERAVLALGNIGQSAVPDLINALKSECRRVLLHAPEALGRVKDPTAVPGLVKLLSDIHAGRYPPSSDLSLGDERLAQVTTEALKSIGTPEALAAVDKWEQNSRETGSGSEQ
jgi:HEAT repeat protein